MAPQVIGAALRLTGAALQLTGAALQLIYTTLIFDICTAPQMIGAAPADRCRSPANKFHTYIRYTAPQMMGAALQLISTTLIFDIPPLRWQVPPYG